MLPTHDIDASVAFYRDLLGFTVESYQEKWKWAHVRRDDCELMLDESINGDKSGSVVYFYPDNVDALHQELQAKGCAFETDLRKTFYGMHEFRLRDPGGNYLWIGQRKEES